MDTWGLKQRQNGLGRRKSWDKQRVITRQCSLGTRRWGKREEARGRAEPFEKVDAKTTQAGRHGMWHEIVEERKVSEAERRHCGEEIYGYQVVDEG